MMPGRKPAKSTATCELCCDTLEKEQDILKCEGECGCVVHRYCAGVTKRHYETLCKNHSPFVCQWCSMRVSRAIIEQQQSEVTALKSDLAAARATIAKLNEELAQRATSPVAPSYALVASQPQRKRPNSRRQPQRSEGTNRTTSGSQAPTVPIAEINSTPATRNSNSNISSQERVRVEGARRIWGTHPHATTKTIENAIERFCKIQGLRIKRKTSQNVQSRKSSWWFVIHADESVLQQLDTSWEALSTQTSWILKPCSKPADVGNSAQISLDGSAQVQLDTPNTERPTSDSDSQQSTSISTNVNQTSLAVSVSETSQNLSNSASAQPSQQDHPNTGDE